VGVFLFENFFVEHPIGYLINKPQHINETHHHLYATNEEVSHSYQFQVPVEYVLSVSECPIQQDFFLDFNESNHNEDYGNK
jgi:hypothetical protein